MPNNSSSGLLSKRNILGATLIAGVIVGMYMPPFWNGFGGGSITGVGVGDPKEGSQKKTTETASDEAPASTSDAATPSSSSDDKVDMPNESTPNQVFEVVKVLIDEKQFLLRVGQGKDVTDTPIELKELISHVQSATGDRDGIRLRIYRKLSARQSAENVLNDAIQNAKIDPNAVVWVPTPVK